MSLTAGSTTGHISIPKMFRIRKKIEAIRTSGTEDITSYVLNSSWDDQLLHLGIATFSITLNNTTGKFNDYFSNEDSINIYANNDAPATTLKFSGVVDKPSSDSGDGRQILTIQGRHISYQTVKVNVTKNFVSMSTSNILKSLIDTYLAALGFTYNSADVPDTDDSKNFNWEDKPFIYCILEIVRNSDYDIRIDNIKGFHLFRKESIINSEDDIVYGNSLLSVRGFGKNYARITEKVRLYGMDSEGLPIISTAGTGSSVNVMNDYDARTNSEIEGKSEKIQTLLSSEKTEGKVVSKWLETLTAGQMVYIFHNRLGIGGLFRVIRINHNMDRSGAFSTVEIGTPQIDINMILNEQSLTSLKNTTSNNPNDMENSYNFEFNDDNATASHSGTKIENGSLVLQSGFSNGTWTSKPKTMAAAMAYAELRMIDIETGSSIFKICANERDENYENLTAGILKTLDNTGTSVSFKINLISDSNNPNPEVKSAVLLLKG